jgi:hypothetical protein
MRRIGWMSLFGIVILAGCAAGGFNSAGKTTQLRPGMSYDQVVALLGEPKETSMVGGKRVATFWLHQTWKGNVPFDLVFSGNPEALVEWSENEEGYAASQARLGELAQALEESGLAGNGAAASGPNNPELQAQIAGLWWGYAGSTERTFGLCRDGTYFTDRESSYSGTSSDAGGNQVMAWGAASQGSGQGRWTVSGTASSGEIHVQNSDGGSGNIAFQDINDPGCLSIDGNTMCKKSADCR